MKKIFYRTLLYSSHYKYALMSYILFALSFLVSPASAFAQIKVWEDSFYGGVTTGGYSPEYQSGGEGKFSVKIEKGSTIKKAFLMAGRFGEAQALTVDLNGKKYLFDSNNKATKEYQSRSYGGSSCVHIIDVTADINPAVSDYTLNIPPQNGPSNRFNDFCLFIAYENKNLKEVNAAIFLRETDISSKDKFRINLKNAAKKNTDIAISLYCGYICHMNGDGEFVYLDGQKLGQIGGNDSNSGYCGGPLGSFNYKNNELFALNDDKADANVNGSDALINAKDILKDKTKSFDMDFEIDESVYGKHETNSVWGVIVAYGGGGCDMSDAEVSEDATICQGSSVSITAKGGQKYLWSNGNESASIEVTPDKTTVYTVTISSGTCSATDSVKVTVKEKISANAGADTVVCTGSSVELRASWGAKYLWSNGERSNSIIIKPAVSTTYTVTVSDGDCSSTDNVIVKVNPVSLIDAGPDISFDSGAEAVIDLKGPDGMYSWLPTNGLSCSDCKTPMVSKPDSSITYIVTYTDKNGCAAIDSVRVRVKEKLGYYITNPVTPNGDGKNDAFMVSLTRGNNLHYLVYDSSGKLLFKSTPENYTWNCKYKGQIVASGIYIYYLDYKEPEGTTIQKSGTFTISK